MAGLLAACAGQGRFATEPEDGQPACARTEVRVVFISDGDPAAMLGIEDSARRLTNALGSKELEERCNGSTMNRTRGRSIAEVCRQIVCAGVQTIKVSLYSDADMRAVAFEKNGAVFVNTAKVRAGTPGNLAHELAHVLGYSHRTYWGIRRKESVPYVLGRLVDDVGE